MHPLLQAQKPAAPRGGGFFPFSYALRRTDMTVKKMANLFPAEKLLSEPFGKIGERLPLHRSFVLKIDKTPVKFTALRVHRMLKVYNTTLDFYKNC